MTPGETTRRSPISKVISMTDTVKVLKEIRALLNGRVLYGELETARRMLTELIQELERH